MNVIVPVLLMLLALAGGSVGTYFIMDAPRRRAAEKLAKLNRKLYDADQDRELLDHRERKLDSRAAELEKLTNGLSRREHNLAARQQEFDRKAVSYTELENENRLLRTELKNNLVHTAFLEHLRQTDRAGHSSVADQRDQLGQVYFDEVVAAAKKAITASNLPQINQRVKTAAERVRSAGVELTPADEKVALEALRVLFEKAVRVQEEREHQADLREQIREEQKRQREIEEAEEEARQAEQERAAVEAELARARAEAAREAAEAMGRQNEELAARHAATIQALQAKLTEAEAKSQRAISNAQLTKQGCVYVISNIGSFGEGVFKIGMTRRRVRMDRVRELGDASVPFIFDVHMMIECEDAPALENVLHREFSHRRVNRMNPRKEFFRVTLDEIVSVIELQQGKIDYSITEYNIDAKAEDFRNGQLATDEDMREIEKAFAATDSLNATPDEE